MQLFDSERQSVHKYFTFLFKRNNLIYDCYSFLILLSNYVIFKKNFNKFTANFEMLLCTNSLKATAIMGDNSAMTSL